MIFKPFGERDAEEYAHGAAVLLGGLLYGSIKIFGEDAIDVKFIAVFADGHGKASLIYNMMKEILAGM